MSAHAPTAVQAQPTAKKSIREWIGVHLKRNAQDKMPKVTLLFWILKIVATTLGETLGDVASMTSDLGYADSSAIYFGFLFVVLVIQLAVWKFYPVVYWSVILATSTAGTTMSDFMDRTLQLGYLYGSLILIGLLLLTLGVWYAFERTLSVTKVQSRRAELFYWIAILFSNTLGTAFGDFLSDTDDIGYATAAGIILGIIAADAILFLLSRRVWPFTLCSRVPIFWVAFVATRPLGATVGDEFTKSMMKGGLGFGTIGTTGVLAGMLVALVIFQTFFADRASRWFNAKFADTIARFADQGKRMDDNTTRTDDIVANAVNQSIVAQTMPIAEPVVGWMDDDLEAQQQQLQMHQFREANTVRDDDETETTEDVDDAATKATTATVAAVVDDEPATATDKTKSKRRRRRHRRTNNA